MKKTETVDILSEEEISSFIGGHIQVREACRFRDEFLTRTSHTAGRCHAFLLQGKIITLRVVGERLLARVEWFAKNEGCPALPSPRWMEARGKDWSWNISGLTKKSVVRNSVGGLIEIPLVYTERLLVLFPPGYKGTEYGGLIDPVQIVQRGDL